MDDRLPHGCMVRSRQYGARLLVLPTAGARHRMHSDLCRAGASSRLARRVEGHRELRGTGAVRPVPPVPGRLGAAKAVRSRAASIARAGL